MICQSKEDGGPNFPILQANANLYLAMKTGKMYCSLLIFGLEQYGANVTLMANGWAVNLQTPENSSRIWKSAVQGIAYMQNLSGPLGMENPYISLSNLSRIIHL